MPSDTLFRPARVLAELIRAREISAVEVVEAHLAQIEAVNPRLHAVVQLRAAAALADARAADAVTARGGEHGPLHGVPFTVKDWIETNDLVCAAGIEARRSLVPRSDATVVARMRAAGAILLGKTKPGNDDAVYPHANNPYDVSRTPGGSSAGEAAIIAAGGSPFGLGSDSGGSLRWPAHCCGIATLKPTAGLVPTTGHFPRINPMADPRTVIGPMARSVDDLALMLPIIAGIDYRDVSAVPMPVGDPAAVDVAKLRVAFYTAMPGDAPSQDVIATTRAAAKALAEAGATVEEAAPERLEDSLPVTRGYWKRVESISLRSWVPDKESTLTAPEHDELLFEWDQVRRAMLAFMETYDLIVCPVAAGEAPPHEPAAAAETYLYTLPYSLTGNPVAVVRAGATASGLPLGVQVVARHWRDDAALAAAAVVERATGGWQRAKA